MQRRTQQLLRAWLWAAAAKRSTDGDVENEDVGVELLVADVERSLLGTSGSLLLIP